MKINIDPALVGIKTRGDRKYGDDMIYHTYSSMNLIKGKHIVKNSIKQEYDLPKDLELLNKWTIPKVEPRHIYNLGTFEKNMFKTSSKNY